jgi:hypothetical protein
VVIRDQAALFSMSTALPIFFWVFAKVSRMSRSEMIQKLSNVSVTTFRVPSRSSRSMRNLVRDIFGQRRFCKTWVRDLFKPAVAPSFLRALAEVRCFLRAVAPARITLLVLPAIFLLLYFCRNSSSERIQLACVNLRYA